MSSIITAYAYTGKKPQRGIQKTQSQIMKGGESNEWE